MAHKGDSGCSIDGQLVRSGEVFEFKPFNTCIEWNMDGGTKIDFYVVDSAFFAGSGFYDCDSVEIKNKILKHYIWTLQVLRDSNFTFSYK